MPPARDARDPALQVTAATRRLGGRLVLNGVTLTVPRGVMVSLAGPNGAGKSSLLRAIGGRLRLDSGGVVIAGVGAATARAKGQLGVVPQDVALHAHLTVRENLALWAALAGTRRREVDARVREGLAWAGLDDRASARVDTLSGGMRRRANLVAGVLHRPALLLLDEPTVGVDAASRARLYAMLRDLRQGGMGVLIVTHDLQEAAELCDEVVVMDAGTVLAQGAVAALVAAWCGPSPELVVVPVPGAPTNEALRAAGFVAAGDGTWSREGSGAEGELAAAERQLAAAGVTVIELRLRRPTLAGAVAAVLHRAQGAPAEERA